MYCNGNAEKYKYITVHLSTVQVQVQYITGQDRPGEGCKGEVECGDVERPDVECAHCLTVRRRRNHRNPKRLQLRWACGQCNVQYCTCNIRVCKSGLINSKFLIGNFKTRGQKSEYTPGCEGCMWPIPGSCSMPNLSAKVSIQPTFFGSDGYES